MRNIYLVQKVLQIREEKCISSVNFAGYLNLLTLCLLNVHHIYHPRVSSCNCELEALTTCCEVSF